MTKLSLAISLVVKHTRAVGSWQRLLSWAISIQPDSRVGSIPAGAREMHLDYSLQMRRRCGQVQQITSTGMA